MRIKEWFFAQPKMMLLGCLLSILTLCGSIGLLSLSGWFISATAFAGLSLTTTLTFNYLLPSAGVRFFSLLRIIARYSERIVTHEVTFKMLSHLRVSIYAALEPLAPAHLIRYHSGELLNRMVNDVDTLDQLYIRILAPIVSAIVIMIGVGIYIQFFSVTLMCIVCGMLLLSFISLPLILAILGKKTGRNQLLLNAKLRTHLVEGIQGLAELTLLGQWKNHLQKIQDNSHDLIKTQFKMACLQGLTAVLLLCLSGLTLVFILYVATPLIHSHHLNGANLALLSLTALAAFEVITPISLSAQYWSKIRLASQRLDILSTSKPTVSFLEKSLELPQTYDISFNNVTFGYTASQPVLNNFSLQIPSGQHFALIGPSGTGKSTILHLLARFFDPLQGEIRIGGTNINTLSEHDLHSLITLITQRSHLFNASLRDNLLLAKPTAEDAALIDALHQVQLHDWFTTLENGLDTWLGESGVQLSGGQLRRLAVARAVLRDAPLWLLDEPTEGLDHETETAFWTALTPLMTGRTVLMISHQTKRLPKDLSYRTLETA